MRSVPAVVKRAILTLGMACSAVVFSHAQLSGVKTIGGSSPDYPTFSAAVAALTSQGVSGPVTFFVRDGIYTEQVFLTPIPGADSAKTVTFESESGNAESVVLTYATASASANYVFKDSSASHVRLRHLTISSSGTNPSYRRAVELTGELDNLRIEGNIISGIVSTASAAQDLAPLHARGILATDLVVTGNTFLGGSWSVYLEAMQSVPAVGTMFRGNVVSDTSGYGGVFLANHAAVVVDSNVVSSNLVGIDVERCDGPIRITGNRVWTRKTGFFVYASAGQEGARGLTANNFAVIGGIEFAPCGIRFQDVSNHDVCHNSVNVLNVRTAASAFALTQSPKPSNHAFNNILACGSGYAIDASALELGQSDYNILSTQNTGIVRWGGVDQTSLSMLQGTTGLEAHSRTMAAAFQSATDLHLSLLAYGDPAYAGMALPAVTRDIDGDPRPAVRPYIGADEVLGNPLNVRENSATLPLAAILGQNYPNPFNPSTSIDVTVRRGDAGGERVSLVVYDLVGREVATLMDGVYAPGTYTVRFSGASLASGIYLYRLTTGAGTTSRSMLLLK